MSKLRLNRASNSRPVTITVMAKYCVNKLRKDARVGDITDRLDYWVDAEMCGGLLQSSQLDTGSSRAVSMPHLPTDAQAFKPDTS